ncbi:hypothetical protein E2C01_039257 [Portunus trituberculatus]|uniref:Uncharacterized protein n=1 Tax=Portunus trituberculatus TaxID=210409 RepID=A0A5B7FJ74_PORTR|nr:hypothetical protein [Portunus trituberculatus]
MQPHPTFSLVVSKAHRIEGRPTCTSKGKRAGACEVSGFTNRELPPGTCLSCVKTSRSPSAH